ncbi:MAG: hypothetical protein WC548_01540 [Candidatus Pacearchaeota archaeon]
MNLKDILSQDQDLTIKDLQRLQGEYDDRFVAGKGFVGFAKVRHTYAHMGKLMGRLANYVHDVEEGREIFDEDIRKKVIPDLLVYACWLAKEFDVNLDEQYLTRFLDNLKRLHSGEISVEEFEALEKIVNRKLERF